MRRVRTRLWLLLGLAPVALGVSACGETPFQVNELTYASEYYQNGPPADLTIWYSGTPRFPVTLYAVPVPGCSRGAQTCSPGASTIQRGGDPMVSRGGSNCRGNMPASTPPWRITFSFYLVDAAGQRTAPFVLPSTCYSHPVPTRFASLVLRRVPWLDNVLRSPNEVPWDPLSLLRSALLAAGVLLLVAFPAQIFNSTLQAHYEEVAGWFRFLGFVRRLVPGWRPPNGQEGPPRPPSRYLLAGVFLLGGLLGASLDPHFALDAATFEAVIAILIAGAITTSLHIAVRAIALRRLTGLRGYARVYWLGVVVAIVCVAVSKLTDAQPGYLYGVLLGFTLGRAAAPLKRHHEGALVGLGSGVVLVVSVGIWLAWAPVKALAVGTGIFPVVVLSTAMAGVFLAGMTSLLFDLLPLRWLDGEKLLDWRRYLWVVLTAIATFLYVHVVLNNAAGTPQPGRNLAVTLVLFAAFGGLSTAFWAYFRYRRQPPKTEALPAPA